MLVLEQGIDAMTRFGRALADPIRCRILLALREGPGYPADLAELLGITRQRLSNHLSCLRDCGLVVVAPEGRRQRYEIADARLAQAVADVHSAVLAVSDEPTCLDAATEGCC